MKLRDIIFYILIGTSLYSFGQDKSADVAQRFQVGLGLNYVVKPELQASRSVLLSRAVPNLQFSASYAHPVSKKQGFQVGVAVANLSYSIKVINRISSTNAVKSTEFVTPGFISSLDFGFYNLFNVSKYQLELYAGLRLNIVSKYNTTVSRETAEITQADPGEKVYSLHLQNDELAGSARRFPGLLFKLKVKDQRNLESPWDFYLVYHYQRERHAWMSFETGHNSPSIGELRYVNTYFGIQVCRTIKGHSKEK